MLRRAERRFAVAVALTMVATLFGGMAFAQNARADPGTLVVTPNPASAPAGGQAVTFTVSASTGSLGATDGVTFTTTGGATPSSGAATYNGDGTFDVTVDTGPTAGQATINVTEPRRPLRGRRR